MEEILERVNLDEPRVRRYLDDLLIKKKIIKDGAAYKHATVNGLRFAYRKKRILDYLSEHGRVPSIYDLMDALNIPYPSLRRAILSLAQENKLDIELIEYGKRRYIIRNV